MKTLSVRPASGPQSERLPTGFRLFGVVLLLLNTAWNAAHAESVTGTVEFAEIYHLDVGVSGEVASVSVRPGDRVLAGTLLMALDDTVLSAELEAAAAEAAWREAHLQEAIRSWERDNALYEEGSLSTVELDLSRIARLHAETEYQHSLARRAASQSRLNRSRLTAPVAGMVLERNVNPAERINIDVFAGPALVFASSERVVRAQDR